MQPKEKGLQKLTESEMKVNALFDQKQITKQDFDALNELEKPIFLKIVNERINTYKGKKKDALLLQIESITDQNTKNEIWEINHNQITWAISTLMQDFGRMPSKREIADKTELSRQTVHKHLQEYRDSPLYQQQIEWFKFMSAKVLAKVFKFAVNGDIRAARLYFDVVGSLSQQEAGSTLIKRQNNYIQINSMVLSQDNIKSLKPEQVLQIEAILKAALPQPV